MDKWPRGSRAIIARWVGVKPSTVYNITVGIRSASKNLAPRLADAADRMGISTSLYDWLYPEKSHNPLFRRRGRK